MSLKSPLYRQRALRLAIVVALVSSSHLVAAEVAVGVREAATQSGKADVLIALSATAPRQLLRRDGNYIDRRRALV